MTLWNSGSDRVEVILWEGDGPGDDDSMIVEVVTLSVGESTGELDGDGMELGENSGLYLEYVAGAGNLRGNIRWRA